MRRPLLSLHFLVTLTNADFLPNNDIAMARKKRIQKSQEYGAAWAREWSAGVTHVIVDRGLSLSDVKKAIGADRLQVMLQVDF